MDYSLFLFFAIIGLYGAHRLIKYRLNKLLPNQEVWMSRYHNPLFILTLLAISLASYFLTKISWNEVLIPLLLISFSLATLYIFPLKAFSLRSIPRLKAFVVASAWTILVYFIPNMNNTTTLLILGYFCYFLHLAIIADIKDVAIDSKSLKTFPLEFGIPSSFGISIVLSLVFYGSLFYEFLLWETLIFMLLQLAMIYVVFLQKDEFSQYYDYSLVLLILFNFFLKP